MKKIGIFGDSFSSENIEEDTMLHKDLGWSRLLSLENPGDVEIYAKSGASMDFILYSFITHHKKFESVIVNTTVPSRYWLPLELTNKKSGTKIIKEHWCPGIGFTDVVTESCYGHEEILKAMKDFETNVAYMLGDHFTNKLIGLVYYIKTIRPDVIILPGFEPRVAGINDEYNWTLSDISSFEMQKLEPHPWSEKFIKHNFRWMDSRPNHFSIQTNKWMLEHVKGRLNNTFIDWDKNSTFQFKDFAELESYRK